MKSLQILKKLKSSTFKDPDGNKFQVDFKRPMSEQEINDLASQLPGKKLVKDLVEIMKFTKGWENNLPDLQFQTLKSSGVYLEIAPWSLIIGEDGVGGLWIQDINSKGDWGNIYFVGHDPCAAYFRFSKDIHHFIAQIEEYYRNPYRNGDSAFHTIYDTLKLDNVYAKEEFLSKNLQYSNFLKPFEGSDWVVADLRGSEIGQGFEWGAYGNPKHTVRHETDLIWVLKKKEKGFFSKLFSRGL